MFWLLGCYFRPTPYLCKVGSLWHSGKCWKCLWHFFVKVSALLGLMKVMSLFNDPLSVLLWCGYFYFFWIFPSRDILLLGLKEVGCLIRYSLLNFSFQLRASGFFYWIVTAFLHFVVFWSLTWSNVVSWCKELQNLIFRSLAPRAPTPVSWLVGASVSC